MIKIAINDYIESFSSSVLVKFIDLNPWDITKNATSIVNALIAELASPNEYTIENNIAIHESAEVESGAILKGPLIIGPNCFVASSAYLRGGNWLEAKNILGPGVELKSSFIFSGTKLAHFNFVGDSIVGRDANLEAGSIIANYRNERGNKDIFIRLQDNLINTGAEKFGALLGDNCKIGANAVIAPGSLMSRHAVLARLALCDQEKTLNNLV